MTSYSRSPRLIKGGIVLLDLNSGAIKRVVALQYNPDTLTRILAVQAAGGEGDRLEAMRLKGPPNRTIKLDAEIDATNQRELLAEGTRMTAPSAMPIAARGSPLGGTRFPTEALNFDAREGARA